ncbi:MAG: BatA domain-containing protein [Planctomycetales bacterium]|nr:BatA domain-containing protein [Planctomycetales bacterium]
MGFLSNILMHPEMLLAGAAAISVPIIIHLLNRRRFKEVDWAAMDFLLDAEQKNRRRVRVEHLILLLLRCLTMLLIGAMIARPFLSSNFGAMFFDTQQFERIVVLDDSLSTRALTGNRSAFELAREQLVSMVEELSVDDKDDRMTLLLASRPNEPVAAAKPITAESVTEWVDLINELRPTDLAIELGPALQEVDRYVGEPRQDVNRVVYVLSDMMERDWEATEESTEAALPHQILQGIAEKVAGCFVVDMGVGSSANLTVESIQPAEPPIEGVPTRFDVRIRNHGGSEAKNVRVQLYVGEGLPLEDTIDVLPAFETREIGFPVTFPVRDLGDEDDWEALDEQGNRLDLINADIEQSVSVRATVTPEDPTLDVIEQDSTGYYAARVVRGVPVLIVDGDPDSSNDQYRSETLPLRWSLAPGGDTPSGFIVDTIAYTEFDTVPLSRYQIIYLCNVDQLSPTGLEELTQWVRLGGGLVIYPGDRTRGDRFNEQFFAEAAPLSPFGLIDIQGDSERNSWATLEIIEETHQVLRFFQGADEALIDMTKLFNYWRSRTAETPTPDVTVLARLDDADSSVAIAERKVGRGHVISFCFPADFDWTNWPVGGTSLVVNHDMSRYLANATLYPRDVVVGGALFETVDLALVQGQGTLVDPTDERHDLVARSVSIEELTETNDAAAETTDGEEGPPDTGEATAPENSESTETPTGAGDSPRRWRFEFLNTSNSGFYRLQLQSTDGEPIERLFAANVDPSEARLTRIDLDEARRGLFGETIGVVALDRLGSESVSGGNQEYWKWIIVGLIIVLVGEQSLARWFRGRQ